MRQEPMSEFYKEHLPICWTDTQISLKLLVNCLDGETTIDHYVFNQQFNIFAEALEKHWDKDLKMTTNLIKDYWHNISSFFRVPLKFQLFNERNKKRFRRLLEVSN